MIKIKKTMLKQQFLFQKVFYEQLNTVIDDDMTFRELIIELPKDYLMKKGRRIK
jgi:hypothetical protein